MKNNNKKILVSILVGAMLLTSANAVSAASFARSGSGIAYDRNRMTQTTETYVATGGTITVNGRTVNSITNSMMGGGMQMGGRH